MSIRSNTNLLNEIATDKGLSAEAIAVLNRIMTNESGGNTNARANGRSSATGLFQFIDNTWEDYVKKYPSELKADGRSDPKQSIIAAIYFTNDNENQLASNLGRKPNKGEIYLAHFSGAGTAINIIKAAEKNPTAPITEFISPEAMNANGYRSAANEGVSLKMKDGSKLLLKDFTVGDAVNLANGKMELPDKYQTQSSGNYSRDRNGTPDSQGNWIIVAITAVAAVLIAALVSGADDIFSDNNSSLKPSSTPRRPPPRNLSPT